MIRSINNLHWIFIWPCSLQSSQGWQRNFKFLAQASSLSCNHLVSKYLCLLQIYFPCLVCTCKLYALHKNWHAYKKHFYVLWYNYSIVLNKMFRGILSLSLNLFKFKTMAKDINKRKQNNKTEQRALTWRQQPAQLLCWQPTGAAQPTRHPPLSSSPRQEAARVADGRRRCLSHLLLPRPPPASTATPRPF